MKVGIYAPALSALGGGEKYVCELAITLSDDHDVEFVNFTALNRAQLEARFGFNLQNVGARVLRLPARLASSLRPMRHLSLSRASRAYDVFITDEAHWWSFPAKATKNIALLQIAPTLSERTRSTRLPFAREKVYDMTLASYDVLLVNSQFVRRWVKRVYARESAVLYPPCGASLIERHAKDNVILSVGRFFIGGPSKKQLEMIKGFKRLYDSTPEAARWTYHLVGGVDPAHARYLDACRAEAAGYPIVIHPNAPATVTRDLYARASLFWHATGFDQDEELHPDCLESFGITTVEAMAAGCVPLVVNKGGQPEIVRNGVDGILWDTLRELREGTATLMTDDGLRAAMSAASIERSEDFSTGRFKEEVALLFNQREMPDPAPP